MAAPTSSFAIDVPAALLARARGGEAAALEQLFRWFERPVFTLALRICGDRHEADDVLQDTMLKVFSSLDRFRLTSNSDAHSPGKLGREATRFSCEPDYFALRRALETGEGYVGTVEFFPEEGKYHMDGHRTCGVRLDPKETIAMGGRCPVCGRPVTIRVPHRVEALADRRPEYFHTYAFNTLRQLGANFELLSSYIEWLGGHGMHGLERAAEAAGAVSEGAKTMQFKLARAMARRRFDGLAEMLAPMVAAYDVTMDVLDAKIAPELAYKAA